MKRVGVLGTFVWDTIRHPGSPAGAVEQWGGVAYSLAALTAACPPGWCVVPLVRVGADLSVEADRFLGSLAHICSDARLVVTPEPNNRVELRYRNEEEREERLMGGVSGWEWPALGSAARGLDALYVNFLSGYEISLEVARRLRRELTVPLYADLHSLFLGPPGAAGARAARRLPDWEAWLGCFDAVQLNEAELTLLGPADADREALLREVPTRGPGMVIVTRGSDGVRIAARDDWPARPVEWPGRRHVGPGEVVVTDHRAVRVVDGDPTGCGDVWGSVFFASLLAGFSRPAAVERASRAAAAKIELPATAGLAGRLGEVLPAEPS